MVFVRWRSSRKKKKKKKKRKHSSYLDASFRMAEWARCFFTQFSPLFPKQGTFRDGRFDSHSRAARNRGGQKGSGDLAFSKWALVSVIRSIKTQFVFVVIASWSVPVWIPMCFKKKSKFVPNERQHSGFAPAAAKSERALVRG